MHWPVHSRHLHTTYWVAKSQAKHSTVYHIRRKWNQSASPALQIQSWWQPSWKQCCSQNAWSVEKQRDGSAQLSLSNNKQRTPASVGLHVNAQPVRRGREQYSVLDCIEWRNCWRKRRHACTLHEIFQTNGVFFDIKKESKWKLTIEMGDECDNRLFMSEQIPLLLLYMLHGGLHYELRGQPSCVQLHSCPTEKL